MVERIKAVFNWSGGKDSAHALLRVLKENRYEIVALLTTVNRDTQQSTMHNIPHRLLQFQAESIGIPLYTVDLTPKGNMEDYSNAMTEAVSHFKNMGVTHFIFGDIYLNDVKKYRETNLNPLGITVVEPLWDKSTDIIIKEFLDSGLRSVIVTTMDKLGEDFIGKTIDKEFISSLPSGTDPNGENGEYHSFCYDGPIFSHPVPFTLGKPFKKSFEIRLEDGNVETYSYWFTELKE